MSVVTLDGVSVTFGTVRALTDVSLTFERATSNAIMGPNGSGKTTVLSVIAGLLDPTRGNVTVAPEATPIGYVAQRHNHRWMPLTVAEVVRMGRYGQLGRLRPMRSTDRALVEDAARRLEIHDLLRRQFGELSGGQRQRVLVAQALAVDPKLLLLDEPITGLDIPSRERILTIIECVTATGVTVVMTTHHLEEAQRCDRAILLDGQVVAAGPPEETLTPEHLTQAFAGRILRDRDETVVVDEHGHGVDHRTS